MEYKIARFKTYWDPKIQIIIRILKPLSLKKILVMHKVLVKCFRKRTSHSFLLPIDVLHDPQHIMNEQDRDKFIFLILTDQIW